MTERNGNSISVDEIEDPIENYYNDPVVSTKQDLCTLSAKYIIYISLAAKQVRKARQMLAFLPVSTAPTNKFYICGQCMYIVYPN